MYTYKVCMYIYVCIHNYIYTYMCSLLPTGTYHYDHYLLPKSFVVIAVAK